jgi:hypothetical protein
MVRNMPNCPKCNSRVTEAMSFCPTCGASLKVAPTPPPAPAVAPAPPAPPIRREKEEKGEKGEKGEKAEKGEKGEKGEKHEKQTFGPLGPVVLGVVLILLGLLFYLRMTGWMAEPTLWAYFFVAIGIIIILVAIYGAMMAARRHPPA